MAGEQDLFDPKALTGGNEGATEMVIFTHEGKTIVRFREPRLWVALDPQNAVLIGKKLIDSAVACGAQVTIEVPRKNVSREKRDVLITRAILVMRSMGEKGRPPGHIATHVVDSILAAIE